MNSGGYTARSQCGIISDNKNVTKGFTIAPAFYAGAIILTLLCGCAGHKVLLGREGNADSLAYSGGFTKSCIAAGLFEITSYSRFDAPGKTVRIYIEGDGRAWKSRHALSDDPTPSNPVALYLAMEDNSANVAYLARPGQYNSSHIKSCDPVYWSEKRFAPEVIDVMNAAIDIVKAGAKAPDIELIGYSGGATIAVIIAAERNDVVSLRTVAGNLDHKAVNRYHNVSPLEGSLNPIDFATKVSHIPQRHFVSAGDSVIPKAIAESFAGKIGDQRYESITIVEGTSHTAGWQKAWPSLLKLPLYKNTGPDS